jgi:hypothetical protein
MLVYLDHLQPFIARGCSQLYQDGHYAQAVEEAAKAVFCPRPAGAHRPLPAADLAVLTWFKGCLYSRLRASIRGDKRIILRSPGRASEPVPDQ